MPDSLVIFFGALWNTVINKDWEFHLSNTTTTVAGIYTENLILWLPITLGVVKLYREVRLAIDDAKIRKLQFGNKHSLKIGDIMRVKFKKGNGKSGTGGSGGEDDDDDPKPPTGD